MRTIMGLSVATILLAVATIGCDPSTPFDGETPIIIGTILSRDSINGTTGMFVVKDGATSNDCYPDRAPFTLGHDVMVFQNGSPKDTSELKVGRRVSVFAPYATIKPCLPVTPAQGVFLQ